MKNYVILFGTVLIFSFAFIACEKEKLDNTPPWYDGYRWGAKYDNSMVLKWNNAISLAIDNLTPSPAESRAYAIVTLAMHDALNNILPKYETYALNNNIRDRKLWNAVEFTEIANAAVAIAAYDALVAVAPHWKAQADLLLDQFYAEIGYDFKEISDLTNQGFKVGKDAASAVLAKRKLDITPVFTTFPQGAIPGEYQSTMPFLRANSPAWPENAVYAPDWGKNVPFGISSSNQFRPLLPYKGLMDPRYAADYAEVKRLGCNECPGRTEEQSEIARFFIENSSSAINRLGRELAVLNGLDGMETARLLALSHMVVADAHISAFEAKYFHKLWRPITAIALGDQDDNDDTTGDPFWEIPKIPGIRPTPPVPAYPSSHAANGGAAAQLFKLFFGTDQMEFTVTSLSLPNVSRSYESFSQFAEDNSLSRIYAGYNFPTSVTEGEKIGRQIALYVFSSNLRVLR